KAEMKSELDAAIAKADAEISKKSAESEKLIAEIRASALESVEEVAKATTGALVTAMGGNEDDKAIAAAVSQEMKG
ncbi:MAG: F0F1 ATP synthase subunit B', partial [Paracoccaceae bacterium]